VLYGTGPFTLGTERYRAKEKIVETSSSTKQHPEGAVENPVRQRIVAAAFSVFIGRGYEGSNTLEIATRARVSKRELYALVGNKQEMLVACIIERARRLRMPEDLPLVRDRETLARVLLGSRQPTPDAQKVQSQMSSCTDPRCHRRPMDHLDSA
jgi:AcrR family transcriptional regulator